MTLKGYKVLIPAAGTGSRLGNLTKYLNKPLIEVCGKPAISRIIDMFPAECSFVIVLGYKGELLKQFLTLAYPDRQFYFTEVNKYEGEGSGLGLSILSAEKLLQEPFVFCSSDTIIEGKMPSPDRNIAGYAFRKNKDDYRTLDIKAGMVQTVLEKGCEKEASMPYIGLACIKDWQLFWKEMHSGGETAVKQGESYALKKFAERGSLYAQEFEWFDTGSINELEKTRAHFKNADAPNILPKPDEAVWFAAGKVIKYSDNKNFIKDRIKRAALLKGFVPEITAFSDNMYVYKEVQGEVLSKIKDINVFKKLLECSETFWQRMSAPADFNEICRKFYYDKTLERIDLYYKTFSDEDKKAVINGIEQPALSAVLKEINWENICSGLAGRFHGDFHFENILYNEKEDKFTFLDWRQNFGGLYETGDIYYDLAKLLHGLIICHELIAENRFNIEMNGSAVNYSFERKPVLIECEKYYYEWLKQKGFDINKIKILTALIYLNIAALHHKPYCHLLYYLGRTMLYENVMEKEGVSKVKI